MAFALCLVVPRQPVKRLATRFLLLHRITLKKNRLASLLWLILIAAAALLLAGSAHAQAFSNANFIRMTGSVTPPGGCVTGDVYFNSSTFAFTPCGTGGFAPLSSPNLWTGLQNFSAGELTSNLDGMMFVDGTLYTTCQAAITAAGAVNHVIIVIPSTYTGPNCPLPIYPNIVFWDFHTPTGTAAMDNNAVTWNYSTPGNTYSMRRTQMTQNSVVATGSIVADYILTTLRNATATGGTIDGASTECDISGTFSGTINICTGDESVAFILSTGGTVPVAAGLNGYVAINTGSTTAVTNAYGVYGLGCRGSSGTVTNCYGVFAERELGFGTGRNYAIGVNGKGLVLFDGNIGSGGFDFEDHSHVIHSAIYSAGDDSLNFQALTTAGINFEDSTGVGRARILASGFDIRNLANDTGLQAFNSSTTCTTAGSVGAICTTGAITLPVAYADTNYRASCTGQGPTNVPIVQTITKSNTTFTITVAALTAAAANFSNYDCIVAHN
jgi:hypothetical protein